MTLERTQFVAAEALREMVENLDALARQKSIRLTAEIEPDLPAITADQPKLKQIMYNLLSNAIKFTPAGGRVSVMAGVEGKEMEVPRGCSASLSSTRASA